MLQLNNIRMKFGQDFVKKDEGLDIKKYLEYISGVSVLFRD